MTVSRSYKIFRSARSFILAALTVFYIPIAAWSESLAEQVTEASAIDKGLCAAIITGDGPSAAMPAELALKGRMLVHAIAVNDAALAAAKKAISDAKAEGLVTVEKLSLKPLPFRDNLVNILVVDDAAKAAEAGFTKEEAMRVIAPMGKLCVMENGRWNVTARPLPPEMDEWTHEAHGPDGGYVSNDKVFHFPIGYRWNAGIPMNLLDPKRYFNGWTNTRAVALSGGRCFTLSSCEMENLPAADFLACGQDQYVTCRDAFNGLLIWRTKVGPTSYGGVYYMNRAPLVATSGKVYVASSDQKLLALDAATGEISKTFDTTHAPGKLIVDNGVIATATWKNGASITAPNDSDRRRMDHSIEEGTVEAYDENTGKLLWKTDKLATSMRSSDGILFMVLREGADMKEGIGLNPLRKQDDKTPIPARPAQKIVAVELKTGAQLWEIPSSDLNADDYLRVDSAGIGTVAVLHDTSGYTTLLSAKTGKTLAKAAGLAAYLDGSVFIGGKKYDPQTGAEKKERAKFSLAKPFCVQNFFVNGITINNRGGGMDVNGKYVAFSGARGACLVGSVPAYGCIYTAQNYCTCVPAQIQGFLAIGPITSEPTAVEMENVPELEKGPAFGAQKPALSQPADEWPMMRKDAERSSSTAANAPEKLNLIWKTLIIEQTPPTLLTRNWIENLSSPISEPVVSGGNAYVAIGDRQQLVALDAGTGREKWRFTAGGRIDSAPSLVNGLSLFGAHDGYLYAVDASDGRLAWRLRMAPREERMVSYGKVESPWPVIGTVSIVDGLAYAIAGRSQGSDGGCVLRAIDPSTGAVRWSKSVGSQNPRPIDIPIKIGDAIQVMLTRFDAKTGTSRSNPTLDYQNYLRALYGYKQAKDKIDKTENKEEKEKLTKALPQEPKEVGAEVAPSTGNEGYLCWNWTKLGTRKYQGIRLGNFGGTDICWNEKLACAIGGSVTLCDRSKVKAMGIPFDNKELTWNKRLPQGYMGTSLILCGNVVLVGGGVFDAKSPVQKGFIQMFSLEKGDKTAECLLDAPLAYNGLSVAGGKIYASLDNGTVFCFGN